MIARSKRFLRTGMSVFAQEQSLRVIGVGLVLATLAGGLWWYSPVNAGRKRWKPVVTRQGVPIQRWGHVEDLPDKLALFPTVFWEPLDSESLRSRIRSDRLAAGKRVLEIGVGSGLISLCCVQGGADRVVGTDINPNAIECARFNAARRGWNDRVEFRAVDPRTPGAYSVVAPNERFDLIVSNPPWENGTPKYVDEHALYDPDFQLLDSILREGRQHLMPGGEIWLAYGCRDAIANLIHLAEEHRYGIEKLDDREWEQLPEVFLPGMLFRLRPLDSDRDNRDSRSSDADP